MKTRPKQRTKTNIRSEKSEHAVNKHKKRSERLVRKVPCRSERTRSIWSRDPERDARNVFYACLQRVRSFPNECSFSFTVSNAFSLRSPRPGLPYQCRATPDETAHRFGKECHPILKSDYLEVHLDRRVTWVPLV